MNKMSDIFRYSFDDLNNHNFLEFYNLEKKTTYRKYPGLYCLFIEGLNLFGMNDADSGICEDPRILLIYEILNKQNAHFYFSGSVLSDCCDSFNELFGNISNYNFLFSAFDLRDQMFSFVDSAYSLYLAPDQSGLVKLAESNDLAHFIFYGGVSFSIGFSLYDLFRQFGSFSLDIVAENIGDGLLFVFGHDGANASAYTRNIDLLNDLKKSIDEVVEKIKKSEWYIENEHHLAWSAWEQCLIVRNIAPMFG